MRININLEDGYLPDTYGKYAAPADSVHASCVRSFPFQVEDIPAETQALGILFYDWDSTPVCGFPWIHWCSFLTGPFEGALSVPDDISRKGAPNLFNGYNSSVKSDAQTAIGYLGPCPPDCDHCYTLRVFALDSAEILKKPFYANELVHIVREHVIDEAQCLMWGRS